MRKFADESLTKRSPHRQKERVHRNEVTFHNSRHAFKLLIDFKESLAVFPVGTRREKSAQILDESAID